MSSTSSIRNGHTAFQSHRRNLSVPTTASSMMMTPPVSPPFPPPVSAASAAMNALRRPVPAHLNLSAVSPSYTQPVIGPNRYTQPCAVPPSNPYELSHDELQRHHISGHLPPEYAYHGASFDLHSMPTSPTSPVLHPAYPLAAAGDESLFDRWLRHEEMGRPIFPGSRTGSSIATSDISSVRGGMFGSLPGGRATGPATRHGPGSVASAATRDRDNFTSSAPSYPSSRAGLSRPASRDGDATSVNGESYPPSIISSDVYPPSIDARLQYIHAAPPAAPTPPRSSLGPLSSDASTLYRNETIADSEITLPEGAATRPPRYSDSLQAPPYQLPLAELLNTGIVGYQDAPILTYGTPTAATEKAILAGIFGNSVSTGGSEGAVVMVRQEVWEELRRRAGLDGGLPDGAAPAVEDGGSAPSGVSPSRKSMNRRSIRQKVQEADEDARCCGACVIC